MDYCAVKGPWVEKRSDNWTNLVLLSTADPKNMRMWAAGIVDSGVVRGAGA